MPIIAELNAEYVRHLEEVRDGLLAGWPDPALARAAIGHALEFSTWQSIVRRQGCTTDEAIGLMRARAGVAEPR